MVAIGRVPWTTPARGRGRLSRLVAAAVAVVVGGALAAVAPTAASAATVDTNASYVLVNRNSGKALDLYASATNDGAR
ncbi:glycoside hydrolase, partial [Micromonospora sp. NPDC048843]